MYFLTCTSVKLDKDKNSALLEQFFKPPLYIVYKDIVFDNSFNNTCFMF